MTDNTMREALLKVGDKNPSLDLDFRLHTHGKYLTQEKAIVASRAFKAGAAWQAAQSVPVVGEPIYWIDPDDDANLSRIGRVGWSPLYGESPASIQAAELARLREKAALLEQELETERMRLAACGVIALANTANSAIQARDMLPEYWSASAQDCASAVDREMDYRSRLAMAEKDRDELQKRAERMQKALSDIAEWTDRYTTPGHPVSTIARAAIAQEKGE